tara:strand:+ start:521 stop:1018 length:498 start_codon:yes stop_codon:yes gene_type:complete
MLSEKLQSAINNLRIRDVYFDSIDAAAFDRTFDFGQGTFHVQQKFGVNSFEVKESEEQKVVLFKFEAGIRWVTNGNSVSDEQATELEDSVPPEVVLAHIESEIVASYLMRSSLDEDSLQEFAVKNCGIHVWPFWREFLSTHCERLRLPRVMLPITQFQNLEAQSN